MEDYILPLTTAVKISASNRGKVETYDTKMTQNLGELLLTMMHKGFNSYTFCTSMHKDKFTPLEMKSFVETHFGNMIRVEVMKDFFTVTLL